MRAPTPTLPQSCPLLSVPPPCLIHTPRIRHAHPRPPAASSILPPPRYHHIPRIRVRHNPEQRPHLVSLSQDSNVEQQATLARTPLQSLFPAPKQLLLSVSGLTATAGLAGPHLRHRPRKQVVKLRVPPAKPYRCANQSNIEPRVCQYRITRERMHTTTIGADTIPTQPQSL